MGLARGQFEYLSQIMRQHCSMVFEPEREYLIESRLAKLSRQEGFASVSALVDGVRSCATLQRKVMDALTNNETWFFRDLLPYEGLRKTVLPELIAARAATQQLVIWSAACSSGQEPYTIAMVIREHFPELLRWNCSIVATDFSQAALQRAMAGRYSQLEVNRGLPARLLARYFRRVGADWEIAPEIRNMVQFRSINLAYGWDLAHVDVLFMRNVLIYFAVPTKSQILERASRTLNRDGYLLLGAAESTVNLSDSFERVEVERTSWYRLR